MNALKIFGIVFGFFTVVLLVTITLQSPQTHVERSITINASPSTVFPYFNDLKKYNEWWAWGKLDPNIQQTYEGPPSGVGSKMSWISYNPEIGTGSQWIEESEENKRVKAGLQFAGLEGHYVSEAVLSPIKNGTRVTYHYYGDVSNTGIGNVLIGKFFGMFTDNLVGKDYEQGLKNLKEVVEQQPQISPLPRSTTDSTAVR